MDIKTLSTLLFRVFGVTYLVYGIFYIPYIAVYAIYSRTWVMSCLMILTYLAAGAFLVVLSKALAALVVKGLDATKVATPPPPPSFQN